MDWVIGGEKMVGQGWRMLMECLAAGRSISLPSSSAAGAKSMLRNTTAYARIRKQFDLPIGKMEGLEEPLARMVEIAYVNEAARARDGVDGQPRREAVGASRRIMKYQTTERLRRSLNDAMDLHGGRGICDGPSNYLQSAYQTMPVGITVEGANILTRSLITFAQGALRSHPYLYKEIQACQDADEERGLAAFDDGLPRPRLVLAVEHLRRVLPQHHLRPVRRTCPRRPTARREWYRQLWRASRNFALRRRPDGGGARRRPEDQAEAHRPPRRRAVRALPAVLRAEALRGRRQAGQRPPHRGAVRAQNGLFRFQEALRGTIDNFPVAPVRWLMRVVVFPFGAHYKPAPDWLGHKVVELVLTPGEVRDRLTRYIYVSQRSRTTRPACSR